MSSLLDPKQILENLRNVYKSGRTRNISVRRRQLYALLKMVQDHEQEICEALGRDFKRSRLVSMFYEIQPIKDYLNLFIDNFGVWQKPCMAKTSLFNLLDRICIQSQPYGVVLIIPLWQLPFAKSMRALIAAIAAGNCTHLILPSKTPNISNLLETIMPQYVSKDCYQLSLADDEQLLHIVAQDYDYIYFEGSKNMCAHLLNSPSIRLKPAIWLTGCKNIVYIDSTTNLNKSMKCILWSKYVNCGLSDLAPHVILCDREVQEKLLVLCPMILEGFYGANIKTNEDYCRIFNTEQLEQLIRGLEAGTISLGGEYDSEQNYISPTILTDVDASSPFLDEDFWGPILIIINTDNIYTAANFLNKRSWIINCLYIFSNNQQEIDHLINVTKSGAVCVNDCLGPTSCEWDGLNKASRCGTQWGKNAFDTFSMRRTCIYKEFTTYGNYLTGLQHPPHTWSKLKKLKWYLNKRSLFSINLVPFILFFALGIVLTVTYYEYVKTKNK